MGLTFASVAALVAGMTLHIVGSEPREECWEQVDYCFERADRSMANVGIGLLVGGATSALVSLVTWREASRTFDSVDRPAEGVMGLGMGMTIVGVGLALGGSASLLHNHYDHAKSTAGSYAVGFGMVSMVLGGLAWTLSSRPAPPPPAAFDSESSVAPSYRVVRRNEAMMAAGLTMMALGVAAVPIGMGAGADAASQEGRDTSNVVLGQLAPFILSGATLMAVGTALVVTGSNESEVVQPQAAQHRNRIPTLHLQLGMGGAALTGRF